MPAIDTPCVKVCTLDPTSGLCLGCGRSLDEIALWSTWSDEERRRVMALLPTRMHALGQKRSLVGG
jgi:uncharacterized protein